MARRLPPRLIALSPGDLSPQRCDEFIARARAALEAGLRGILLRESGLGDRAYLELAGELASALDATGDPSAWLGVHDRPHLAQALGAQAVHLGFRSLTPREIRPWLPPSIALGLSAHEGDPTERWKDADYLFHGPVFATPSKAGRVEPTGVRGLARAVELAAAHVRAPVWAIGGLRPEHALEVSRAGASGLAVRAAVLGATDVAAAVRAWRAALDAAFSGD
jgi:thiamine-phosphate pyrophosphorylase